MRELSNNLEVVVSPSPWLAVVESVPARLSLVLLPHDESVWTMIALSWLLAGGQEREIRNESCLTNL